MSGIGEYNSGWNAAASGQVASPTDSFQKQAGRAAWEQEVRNREIAEAAVRTAAQTRGAARPRPASAPPSGRGGIGTRLAQRSTGQKIVVFAIAAVLYAVWTGASGLSGWLGGVLGQALDLRAAGLWLLAPALAPAVIGTALHGPRAPVGAMLRGLGRRSLRTLGALIFASVAAAA